ncbi:DNA-directed DNA/RNA polymerase mu [Favolaschia claudopus]|uniref:DNA polymerase n=1 Tax=Favolaschia claudopus TaxID=2862362 RepID=A0AAW0E064_9AGAR
MRTPSSSEPPSKRRRMSSDNSPSLTPTPTGATVKLYLVQAKLTSQDISELFSLVEAHNLKVNKSPNNPNLTRLQFCHSPDNADTIMTNVRMRKRLERHIDWELAKDKAIVTPDWLRDSVQQNALLPCGDYAALRELKQNTIQNCPDSDSDEPGQSSISCLNSSARPEPETEQSQSTSITKTHYTSRYACLRPCPMVCKNQDLVRQLGVIRRSRELEGKDVSALSYERTISTDSVAAYPYVLNSSRLDEISKLPGIGDKMFSKISEYVSDGKISESQTIAASSRYKSLCLFTQIHGIGPTTARNLYDSLGLRTIDDLKKHYHSPNTLPAMRDSSSSDQERRMTTPAPTLTIKAALALLDDLNEKIPREEVDLMHDTVMAELEKLRPECSSTIVGGYRRGKAESNDVDIVITHPKLVSGSDQVMSLGQMLVNRLHERGLITHVMHLSGFHPPDALRTSNWDTLEKALTVFILPPVEGSRRVHRRLDLIFAAPEAYWTAITGWTGSKMFERDLRLWAKERGMKFDSSGITRRRDSKQYFPRSEQEVFDVLGLQWIDPTLRNADL